MKVHDCVLFSNELDLLYLRLSELDPVVDNFVIVQATTTFQGAERPLVSIEDDSRFKQFSAKMRHIVVDDLPRGTTPWFAEFVQRDRSGQALLEHAKPDDLVLLSDVDEIPSREAVEKARTIERGQVGAFDMRFFYYGLNWEVPFGWDGAWHRARAFRAEALSYVSAQELRICPPDIRIPESGWHFSYCYRRAELVDHIREKATSFAHTEFSRADYLSTSYLDFCIRGGLQWCTSPKYTIKFRFHDLDETYPEPIRAQASSWNEYCIMPEERDHATEARAWLLCIAANVAARGRQMPASLKKYLRRAPSHS